MTYEELYQAEHAGRLAAETAWLEAQNRVSELEKLLAAEQAKTARLLRQIRNRELADTGLYDEYGQPYK
jgi:hypothetical protein